MLSTPLFRWDEKNVLLFLLFLEWEKWDGRPNEKNDIINLIFRKEGSVVPIKRTILQIGVAYVENLLYILVPLAGGSRRKLFPIVKPKPVLQKQKWNS